MASIRCGPSSWNVGRPGPKAEKMTGHDVPPPPPPPLPKHVTFASPLQTPDPVRAIATVAKPPSNRGTGAPAPAPPPLATKVPANEDAKTKAVQPKALTAQNLKQFSVTKGHSGGSEAKHHSDPHSNDSTHGKATSAKKGPASIHSAVSSRRNDFGSPAPRGEFVYVNTNPMSPFQTMMTPVPPYEALNPQFTSQQFQIPNQIQNLPGGLARFSGGNVQWNSYDLTLGGSPLSAAHQHHPHAEAGTPKALPVPSTHRTASGKGASVKAPAPSSHHSARSSHKKAESVHSSHRSTGDRKPESKGPSHHKSEHSSHKSSSMKRSEHKPRSEVKVAVSVTKGASSLQCSVCRTDKHVKVVEPIAALLCYSCFIGNMGAEGERAWFDA